MTPRICLAALALIAASPVMPAAADSRDAELQRICSDPENREPGSFFYAECQSVDPRSQKQLEKDWYEFTPE